MVSAVQASDTVALSLLYISLSCLTLGGFSRFLARQVPDSTQQPSLLKKMYAASAKGLLAVGLVFLAAGFVAGVAGLY